MRLDLILHNLDRSIIYQAVADCPWEVYQAFHTLGDAEQENRLLDYLDDLELLLLDKVNKPQ
jgi:hypothetical protein